MILNIPSQPRKLNNLLIPKTRSVPTLRRNFSFHRKPSLMIRNMLNHLRNNLFVNNLKRPLVNNEPVRPDKPRNQRLAKAPARLNNDLRRISIYRVESEYDT